MANIQNVKFNLINNNIKNKARRILVNQNGSNVTRNNVGNLFTDIALRIPNENVNKNEIREALLNLGNFLKQYNKDLKDKLSTKFGRYGTTKTTKITKKALAIAIRLKQINESNENIGNINGNNTEIGENNIKNKNNTLPTRAQLLYYIIVYILRILKLKITPISPPPPPPSPEEGEVNINWGIHFNTLIIKVIEAIEKIRKEKHRSGLVEKLRRKVGNARMNNFKKLLKNMVNKTVWTNASNIRYKIMKIFNSLNIKDQGSLWEFISELNKKQQFNSVQPQIIKTTLKQLLNESRVSLNKTSGQTTEKK